MRLTLAAAVAANLLLVLPLAGCSSGRGSAMTATPSPVATSAYGQSTPAPTSTQTPTQASREYLRARSAGVEARPTGRALNNFEYRADGVAALAAPALPGTELNAQPGTLPGIGSNAAFLGSPDAGPMVVSPAPVRAPIRPRAAPAADRRPARACPPRLPFCIGGT